VGFILTAQGQIMCPHGGVAPLASLVGSPQHQIGGQNMLTTMHIGPVPFACPMRVMPCIAVTGWLPNQTKMFIKGMPVLTDSSRPITNNGPGSVVFAGQVTAQVG
jgi:hypothetical protein